MKRIRILSVLAVFAMITAMLSLCVSAQTKTSTYDLSGIFESSTCGKGTISFVYGTDAAPAALVADPSSLIRLDKLKTELPGDVTAPNWMTGKMYKSSDARDTYAHFVMNADNTFAYVLPEPGIFNAIVFTAPAAGDYSYTLTASSIWDASDCDVQIYSGTKQLQEVTLNKGANQVASSKASHMENGDKLYFFFVHTANAYSDIRIEKLVITGVTEVETEKPPVTESKKQETEPIRETTEDGKDTEAEVTTDSEAVTTGTPAGETTAEQITTGEETTAEKDTDAPVTTAEPAGSTDTAAATGGTSSDDKEETNPLLWVVIALLAALAAAVVVIIVLLKKLKSK